MGRETLRTSASMPFRQVPCDLYSAYDFSLSTPSLVT